MPPDWRGGRAAGRRIADGWSRAANASSLRRRWTRRGRPTRLRRMRAASSSVGFDPRRLAAEVGLGFVYWLSFVLVLEPGNLVHWVPPDAAAWGREALRLCAAGVLGAAATPAIVAVSRRLPVEGPSALRRAGVHLLFILAMTLVLIVASCVFARLMPGRGHRPFVH